MAKKKLTEAEAMCIRTMTTYAREWLEKEPVVEVLDFEQRLHDRFKNTWGEWGYEKMHGKDRLRWENLTDWVKANLTSGDEIEYVSVRSRRFIVFLAPVGHIHGHLLVRWGTAHDVVRAMANRLARYVAA